MRYAMSRKMPTLGPKSTAQRSGPSESPISITHLQPMFSCDDPSRKSTMMGRLTVPKVEYCAVLTGRDPKEGILIKLPPHRGPVTLRFNLHNRHTYSEEEVRLKRGFASYAAGIGVLTMDNTLLSRAAVATEFRTAADLLERISGGAGPGGVKAVAPVGSEAISLELPAELSEVTILGEKLTVIRADGQPATYTASGRPIAIVSDVTVEYVPAPAPARRSR